MATGFPRHGSLKKVAIKVSFQSLNDSIELAPCRELTRVLTENTMSGKNKTSLCNCKEVEEREKRLISMLNDERGLLQNLRKENAERIEVELRVQALIDINHGWKRDYEELQRRYEMLSGEKKLLEEEKELKERVGELERRQGPLESEITRLAASALYTRSQVGGCDTRDEQYEILKTQIRAHKDFERDRENLYKEKEKLKRELELAAELAWNADKYGITENGMPVRREEGLILQPE